MTGTTIAAGTMTVSDSGSRRVTLEVTRGTDLQAQPAAAKAVSS
jgi:hypothetical protein